LRFWRRVNSGNIKGGVGSCNLGPQALEDIRKKYLMHYGQLENRE